MCVCVCVLSCRWPWRSVIVKVNWYIRKSNGLFGSTYSSTTSPTTNLDDGSSLDTSYFWIPSVNDGFLTVQVKNMKYFLSYKFDQEFTLPYLIYDFIIKWNDQWIFQKINIPWILLNRKYEFTNDSVSYLYR